MFQLILSNVGITPREMFFTGMLVYYARMSVNGLMIWIVVIRVRWGV